jgi:FtsH-binding integral membrane protein
MNKLTTLKNSFIFTLILSIIITYSVFPKFQITCNHYVMNTYLYITMAFTLLYVFLQLYDIMNVDKKANFGSLIGMFILSIGLIICIQTTSPKNILLKHVLWILFLAINSFIFYPLFKNIDHRILHNTFITTIIITFLLSCIVYIYPDIISFSIGPILFTTLFVVIIVELVNIFLTKNRENMNKKQKWISLFCILLFCLFILYDTKVLLYNAQICNIRTNYPDYISESFHIFLDMLNIFIHLLNTK